MRTPKEAFDNAVNKVRLDNSIKKMVNEEFNILSTKILFQELEIEDVTPDDYYLYTFITNDDLVRSNSNINEIQSNNLDIDDEEDEEDEDDPDNNYDNQDCKDY